MANEKDVLNPNHNELNSINKPSLEEKKEPATEPAQILIEMEKLNIGINNSVQKGNMKLINNITESLEEMAVHYIKIWQEMVKDSDVVVISVGSAHQPAQLEPEFAKEARIARKKVSILNIDTGLTKFTLSPDNSDLKVNYRSSYSNKPSRFDEAMDKAILDISKTKKVILCTFTYPSGCDCFIDVNKKKDNNNIEFLNCYFVPLGVMQLKPESFNKLENEKKEREFWEQKVKELGPEKTFELSQAAISKEPDNFTLFEFYESPKSKEEINTYNKEHGNYGKFYASINNVTAADLGIDISKKRKKASESQTPSSSMHPEDTTQLSPKKVTELESK